jgi:hypothetical protein
VHCHRNPWPRAEHAGGDLVDYHAMSALDARVEPVHDETESAAFVSGRGLRDIVL